MRLKELYIENYRNYKSKRFEFDNNFVIFYGDNGAGKTNILESISYLSAGNGLKKAKLSELSNVLSETNYFKIKSLFKINDIFYTINCNYDMQNSPFRQVEMDDKKTTQIEMSHIIKILWITPLMDKVFTDGTISSRKLIDKLTSIFYNNHKEEISDLNKLFKQRNYLIKYGVRKENMLNSLDIQISNLSVSIATSRHLFIEKLNKELKRRELFPSITITLSGFIEDKINQNIPSTIIEEEYLNYLKEKRLQDDLIDSINKTKISIFNDKLKMLSHMTSTGQQKIMLFSIILSCCYMINEIKGYTPLLLLDEVVAHLDIEHKKQLFEELQNLNIQVFLTGVFKEDFDFLQNYDAVFLKCYNQI